MVYFAAGEWPVSYAGTGCSAFDQSGMEQVQEFYEQIAVELLWNWTNRVFGTRREIIRPSRVVTPWRPSTFEGLGPEAAYWELGNTYGWGWLPVYSPYGWLSLRCGLCGAIACQCGESLKALHLPGPVEIVHEVKIEADVLDPAAYRLDYGHTLIRQDGETWPSFQDLIEPLGSPRTWSIDYTHGIPVPYGGQLAAGLLACELYKAAQGDETCGLPSRVQSIARQGVSMELVQTTFAEAQDGRTGIWAIDSWIAAVTKPRAFASVASPDITPRPLFDPGWRR